MRIPLTVGDFYSGRKVVFANFFLHIPSMRVARSLSAVVDSGSPFTSISTRDALALGLPIKSMEKEQVTYLAGNTFYGKNVKGTLTFRDSDNKAVKFTREIRILIPTKLDAKTIRDVQDIPSLVGTDFIEDHQLTFVYSPSTLTAYFDSAAPVIQPPLAVPQSSSNTRTAQATNQSGTTLSTN